MAGGTGARDAVTIGHLMRQAQGALLGALRVSDAEARIEVRMLLCRALGNVPHAWLIAHECDAIPPDRQPVFEAVLQRRLAGEPIAYILGEREFFGLTFKVSPATLIPRPETELLVEQALLRIPEKFPSPSTPLPRGEGGRQAGRGVGRGRNFRLLDMGAGCGAIALAIARSRPDVEVLACDNSAAALEVARENAQRLGVANAAFIQSDWYAALGAQRFNLIVSNPPYIAANDPHLAHGDLRFEPSSALASGGDGRNDIRHIVAHAQAHLEPGGWLLLEHGYDQAAQVRQLLRQAGLAEVFSARDLAGIERISGGYAMAKSPAMNLRIDATL